MLIEQLFGNEKLLKLPKTAFLCSRQIPASIILKCYDWAIAQRDAGNCIISGFHSTIEKDVFHYLLKGKQPVIIALARGLKNKIEPELLKPLGQADQFYHIYEYDADNRITNVKTSNNGILWTSDANYYYYDHGPLLRTELGDLSVQGLDYIYTIQGWIKALNTDHLNPNHDPGGDGTNNNFNRDAFGYELAYFSGDYQSIGGKTNFEIDKNSSNFENNSRNLYNGNIKQMTIAMMDTGGNRISEMGTDFYYDQLNRINSSVAYFGNAFYQQSSPVWGGTSSVNDYFTSYAYDPNGNITRLVRNATSNPNVEMDNLSYHYYDNTNQLRQISDAVNANNFTVDIDDQSAWNNYLYDQSGNLIGDVAEGLTITWNVYGKIKQVQKTGSTTTDFAYDPAGNRIKKAVSYSGDTTSSYYLRDAQGNILSLYEKKHDTLFLTEQYLYGSTRLGMKRLSIPMNHYILDTTRAADSLGYRLYELTNHLGNVQATISDRKIPHQNDSFIDYFETDVRSAVDYYPFGMEMPGRNFPDEMTRYIMNPPSMDSVTFPYTAYLPNFGPMSIPFSLAGMAGVFDFSLELDSFGGQINVVIQDGSGHTVFNNNYNSVPQGIVISTVGISVNSPSYNVTITPAGTGYYYIGQPHVYQLTPSSPTAVYRRGGRYRFGYQGSEKDNEISGEGNTYTTLFRELDVRGGHWWTIDPKTSATPWESPYVSMGDNPIINNDQIGDTWDPTMWDKRPWYDVNRYISGTPYKHFTSTESKNNTYNTILVLKIKNPTFEAVYQQIKNSTKVYSIDEVNDGSSINYEGMHIGTKINLVSNRINQSSIFEEVFHAGQYENYDVTKSLNKPNTELSREVEAKVAKALTGVHDDFNMSDGQKQIMNKYYNTLKSGKKISSELRGQVNTTLTEFANYLIKEGGYDNLAGELKDFDPNKTLNYFEKITKKVSSKSKW